MTRRLKPNHSTEHPMKDRIRHRAIRALSLCCAAVLTASGALPGGAASVSAALNAPQGSFTLEVFPAEVSL